MDTLSSVRIDILSFSFFLSPSTSYSPSSRRTRQWSPPEHPPRGARLPPPSSTALALAAVTARDAELASDVAAAVHAVDLQKPWSQAPLLPPLVRSLLLRFRRTRQWSPPEHPPRGARLTSPSSTPLNTSAFLFANKRIQIQTVLAVKRWRQRSE